MMKIFLLMIICLFIASCAARRASVSMEKIDLQLIEAYYYEKTGQHELANQIYLSMIQRAPYSGAVHNNYGVFLCRRGYLRKGVQQFLLAAHNRAYPKKQMAYHNAVLCEKKE